jgi:hypothetical protein
LNNDWSRGGGRTTGDLGWLGGRRKGLGQILQRYELDDEENGRAQNDNDRDAADEQPHDLSVASALVVER